MLSNRWPMTSPSILGLAILCWPASLAAAGGPQVHRNEEFGIQARFPSGIQVCEALSGDHPIGFYAWLGRQTDCGASKPPSVGAMNVTALYNAAFYTSPSLPGCRAGSVPRGSRIDLSGLAFRGLRSVSCATRQADGSLEVFVAAQGGSWGRRYRSPETRAPLIDYSAVLKTNPERLRRDMATFRTLLSHIVIRHIVSE